jgi:hypothetical protein
LDQLPHAIERVRGWHVAGGTKAAEAHRTQRGWEQCVRNAMEAGWARKPASGSALTTTNGHGNGKASVPSYFEAIGRTTAKAAANLVAMRDREIEEMRRRHK